jgi:hypothetical protein
MTTQAAALETREQGRSRGREMIAALHGGGQHGADHVDGLQQERDELRRDGDRARAQCLEQVLDAMRELAQPDELQGGGVAFQGVELPEDGGHALLVIRRLLERQQCLLDDGEVLLRLRAEGRPELLDIEVHSRGG